MLFLGHISSLYLDIWVFAVLIHVRNLQAHIQLRNTNQPTCTNHQVEHVHVSILSFFLLNRIHAA
ncbi:Uncharacterised protein [Segatella copri]|nr:Uncharacterised protein [Segatella copri]